MENIVILSAKERGLRLADFLDLKGHKITAIIGPENLLENPQTIDIAHRLKLKLILEANNSPETQILNVLKELKPSIGIVAGYNKILKPALLNIPKFGWVNLHPGKLPQYRGGSPVNWQVINGETKIGISVLRVDKGIDTGNLLREDSIIIEESDDIRSLHEKINYLFPILTDKVLEDIEHNRLKEISQDEKYACYWHQRSDIDGRINWKEMTKEQTINFIRAISEPYPGAWTYFNSLKIRIMKAYPTSICIRGTPGRVQYIDGKGPYILCKDGAVLVDELYHNGSPLKIKNGSYLL